MKTVFEHIEHVKRQPHHVRKGVAFSAAASCTALIAFVWLAGSLWSGTFAIKSSSFAESTGQSPTVTAYDSGKSGLAGAAAALQDASAPAHIEIVDAASSTSQQKKAEQTILPF
jgi:hypothetical protein